MRNEVLVVDGRSSDTQLRAARCSGFRASYGARQARAGVEAFFSEATGDIMSCSSRGRNGGDIATVRCSLAGADWPRVQIPPVWQWRSHAHTASQSNPEGLVPCLPDPFSILATVTTRSADCLEFIEVDVPGSKSDG